MERRINGELKTPWSTFLQFNIGHLLIILGMLGSAVWWFVTYDREFTVTKMTVSSLVLTVEKLANKVESMDEHGTRFSQLGVGRDNELSKSNSERVLQLEQVNRELLPRIERVDLNLQSVSEWVKKQRDKNEK